MKKSSTPCKNSSTPRRTAVPRSILRPAWLFPAALLLLAIQAPAATFYWDHAGTTTGTWGTAAEWSSTSGAHTATTVPTSTDFAVFGGSLINNNHSVNFAANRSIKGLQFTTSRNITFQNTAGTNNTLSIGTSGIQIDPGAGIVVIDTKTGIDLTGSQSWINNSSRTLFVQSSTTSLPISTSAAGTMLTLGGTGSIQLNRSIQNGTGSVSVTKTGSGDVALARTSTYTGPTNVNAGTLYAGLSTIGTTGTGLVTVASGATLAGGGTVSGAFIAQSGANVQAGDGLSTADIGVLTFDASGAMMFQSGSITTLGLDPAPIFPGSPTSDKLDFTANSGSLSFDGNLTVTAPGFTPTAAATFDLLDWTAGISSTFNPRFLAGSYPGLILGNGDDSLGFDLPDVSASGYGWDISNLATNGTISLAAVPEPGVAGLALLGLLGGLPFRRRR